MIGYKNMLYLIMLPHRKRHLVCGISNLIIYRGKFIRTYTTEVLNLSTAINIDISHMELVMTRADSRDAAASDHEERRRARLWSPALPAPSFRLLSVRSCRRLRAPDTAQTDQYDEPKLYPKRGNVIHGTLLNTRSLILV